MQRRWAQVRPDLDSWSYRNRALPSSEQVSVYPWSFMDPSQCLHNKLFTIEKRRVSISIEFVLDLPMFFCQKELFLFVFLCVLALSITLGSIQIQTFLLLDILLRILLIKVLLLVALLGWFSFLISYVMLYFLRLLLDFLFMFILFLGDLLCFGSFYFILCERQYGMLLGWLDFGSLSLH